MNLITNPSIIYQKNCQNHLERILECAENLFIRDGIDRVSMNAIAAEARIDRKTLYKFFPSKQEIAFAIFKQFIDQRTVEFDPAQFPQGNGFQRLEFFLVAALYNLINAMNTRFALVGNQIGEEYHQPVKGLYLGTQRIFLQGIRRPATEK